MNRGWKEVVAEDFCATVRDGTHDSPKQALVGKKLVTSRHIIGGRIDLDNAYLISDRDFAEINRRSKVDQWDVLITMIGTVGEPCLVSSNSDFAIKNIGLFKSKSQLHGQWLYYYLKTPATQDLIRSRTSGTTQAYIALGTLRSLPIVCPSSAAEMAAIVNCLAALDDKIELNRKMNETLEAMARALFRDWFVDFDPTRAKMAGTTPYLSDDLWPLFPDRLDDEGKPEGWESSTVGEIGEVICGKTPSTSERKYYGGEIPFITIPDMHSNIFILETSKTLSDAGSRTQAKKLLPPESICVSCIATLGLVTITTQSSHTNQQINSVLPSKAGEMLYWYFALRDLGPAIKSGGSGGSVLANLSTGRFSALPILHAKSPIRSAFHDAVSSYFDRVKANQYESRTLAQTRDLLLPRLMSGELRVAEADQMVEAAQ